MRTTESRAPKLVQPLVGRASALLVAGVLCGSLVLATMALGQAETSYPIELDDLSARDVPPTGSVAGDALRAYLLQGAPAGVMRGAEIYNDNCAVCHGDTGLGLEEARLSFPADHRACERCHRPGNPRFMSFETMMERQHDLFDVGVPPSLRGSGALATFAGNQEALFAYVRATMPRYQPGRLRDEAYRDVVTFLTWIAPLGGSETTR